MGRDEARRSGGEPGGATADDTEKITANLGRANIGGKPADLPVELHRLVTRIGLYAFVAGALSMLAAAWLAWGAP